MLPLRTLPTILFGRCSHYPHLQQRGGTSESSGALGSLAAVKWVLDLVSDGKPMLSRVLLCLLGWRGYRVRLTVGRTGTRSQVSPQNRGNCPPPPDLNK